MAYHTGVWLSLGNAADAAVTEYFAVKLVAAANRPLPLNVFIEFYVRRVCPLLAVPANKAQSNILFEFWVKVRVQFVT